MQKAAQLAGGQRKLARYLRVPISDLERWIAGKDEPPMQTFLKAVDLVLEETPSPVAGSEPGDPPAPRDCAAAGGTSHFL